MPAPADFEGLTFAEARPRIARRLGNAGIEDPAREARLLIELATGLSAAAVTSGAGQLLSDRQALDLEELVVRRSRGEPVSRLRGVREFYGRPFAISPDVLDPRPETETIIEAALSLAGATDRPTRSLRIMDLGTGSGCLIVTLLAEFPEARGLATDLSRSAIEIARHNAASVGVAERALFEQRRSLDGMTDTFDLLVSNPPYIESAVIPSLDPAVRDFDPLLALDGGADGLDVYREIADSAARVVPQGWILLEVGAAQAEAVVDIFCGTLRHRVKAVRRFNDLAGHVRVVAVKTQL